MISLHKQVDHSVFYIKTSSFKDPHRKNYHLPKSSGYQKDPSLSTRRVPPYDFVFKASRSCFTSWGSCRPLVRSLRNEFSPKNAEAFYRHPKASWFDEIKSFRGEDLGPKTPTDLVFGGTPKRWLSKGIQFAQIDRWWFYSDRHCHFLPLMTWEFMIPKFWELIFFQIGLQK